MFGQTFDLLDLARIGFLALLEILLSADNAIVLGILVRRLPEKLRKKALFIGLISSLVIRGAAFFAISLLFQATWIQFLGGLYLLYLCISHFRSKTNMKPHGDISSTSGFWKTVILVELYDLAFAIDSVIVAVAFISEIPSFGQIHPKLWIVYVGAFIGMIVMRFAANWFSSLIDHFPRMERTSYFMIGWIGLKLTLSAMEAYHLLPSSLMSFFEPSFWIVLSLLFLAGFTKKKKNHA